MIKKKKNFWYKTDKPSGIPAHCNVLEIVATPQNGYSNSNVNANLLNQKLRKRHSLFDEIGKIWRNWLLISHTFTSSFMEQF